VAFIGHSPEIVLPDNTVRSVGLCFWVSDNCIEMTPRVDPRYPELAYTPIVGATLVDKLSTQAKVIFIGECASGPAFQALWDIDENTTQRSLIVPIVDVTKPATTQVNLALAALVWVKIADKLTSGSTVQQAVSAANAFVDGGNLCLHPEQCTTHWKIIGGANVRLKK
jgi:hypothetical protein